MNDIGFFIVFMALWLVGGFFFVCVGISMSHQVAKKNAEKSVAEEEFVGASSGDLTAGLAVHCLQISGAGNTWYAYLKSGGGRILVLAIYPDENMARIKGAQRLNELATKLLPAETTGR